MKKIISFILGSIIALNLSVSIANAAAKEVRVAFFLEWPTPNLEDKVKGAYEKALGVPVKWSNFNTGVEMTDAMLAGNIDIAYSQGGFPFVNAVKSKAPIKAVDIAVVYGIGKTTCITSNKSGITKANAKELEGKKVAVPLGTMGEYVFNESMKVVGADRNKMTIIEMAPEEGAAALVNGDVVMACLFGGNSVETATTVGSRLLTAEEAAAAGILGVDVVSATDKFIKENPAMLKAFVKVTHDANARYKAGKSDFNVIAKDAGMTPEATKTMMDVDNTYLSAKEVKEAMDSGVLNKLLKGLSGPDGALDTSFLPL